MRKILKLKKFLVAQTAVRQVTIYRKDLREIGALSAPDKPTAELITQLEIEHYSSIPKTLLPSLGVSTKINLSGSQGLFAWHNDQLIGCVMLNLEGKGELTEPFLYKFNLGPDCIYAHTLFIKQGFRSNGLGKLLYSELFKLVKSKFSYVYILVDANNFSSNKAAQSLGFQKTREVTLIKFCFIKLVLQLNNRFSQTLFNLALRTAKLTLRAIIAPFALFALLLKKLYETRQNSFLSIYEIWSHQDNEKTKVAFIAMGLFETVFLTKLFPEGFMVRELKKFPRKNLKAEFNRCAASFDIVIADAGLDYLSKHLKQIKNLHFMPHWIVQKNESFSGLDDFCKHKKRAAYEDIRVVRKCNYNYLFTKSEEMLEFFYENMYLPHITQRHKEEATISPFKKIKKYFRNGGLLLIKDNQKFISGTVVGLRNKVLHPYYTGVLNGDEQLLKQDALTTLYYFYFALAQEKGIHRIDLGLSRPFLNDGVLRYKKKWGTAISYNKKRSNAYAFKINSLTSPLKSFLLNHPFIEIKGNRLIGNVFLDSPESVSQEELNKKYLLRGISGLEVSVLNEKNNYQPASQPMPEALTLVES